MKDIELLPCPFCGSDDVAFTSNGHDSEFVECMACGASGPVAVGFMATAEVWNARAAVEADRAQRVPDGKVLVDRGALNLVINALRRDAEQGRSVRGEMADALLASTPAPAQQERKPMTDDRAAEDYFGRSELASNPENRNFENGSFECFLGGVRFAERHHGIFAEPAQGIKE